MRYVVLVLSLLVPSLRAAEPPLPTLPDFLDTAFARRAGGIEARLAPLYDSLCRKLRIPGAAEHNRRLLFPLLFRHSLFTTTDAVDCRHGGILSTTYLWHWVSPNPRHALRRLPDSTPLAGLPPPPGYGKYKSWADVDRLPALYLGDLFAYPPRYWHPRCGEVKTFGWCSEREMAAGVLLQAMKHRSKIKQEGVHVWTEVLLQMEGPDRHPRPAVLSLDHTFDLVDAWPLAGSAEAWASGFGDGAQVGWYNKLARSPEELRKVREIRVSREVSLRFYTEVDAWMGIIER